MWSSFPCAKGAHAHNGKPAKVTAENDATDQEHLGQISKAEFVAKPPERYESNHVARIQYTDAALGELLCAVQIAKPTVALSPRPLASTTRSFGGDAGAVASGTFRPRRSSTTGLCRICIAASIRFRGYCTTGGP